MDHSKLNQNVLAARRRSIVLGDSNYLPTGEEELLGRKIDNLFIVSSRLPLVINLKPGSSELDISPCTFRLCWYKKQATECFAGRRIYVGLLDSSAFGDEVLRTRLAEKLLNEHDCLPVFTSPQTLVCFNDFCKRVLWPTVHSLPVKENLSDEEQWNAYQEVNSLVGDVMSNHVKAEDYVWIHDYHFFLLPRRIKAISRGVRVGFFLHTPFPTTEFFRMLPMRSELLLGVLESDLVGFQTYDYVRHFHRSCVRLLGFDPSPKGVDCRNGHIASVRVLPVGVDFDLFSKSLEPNNKFLLLLKEKFKDKKVIFSRDTLEPIKGVPLKFKAFEKFLTLYPEWIGKVVLVQLLSPPNAGHCSFAPHPTPFNLISPSTSSSPPPSPKEEREKQNQTSLSLKVIPSSSTLLPSSPSGEAPILRSTYSPSIYSSSVRPPPSSLSVYTQPSQISPPQTPFVTPGSHHLTYSSQPFTTPPSDFQKSSSSTLAAVPDPMAYNMGSREEYELLESQVNDIAARINARFGDLHTQPIQCYFHHVTIEELTAFYAHADAALVTPLRDGMNLTSFEFILCQSEKKSPLILSEFCGSARSLSGAIHVNPWYLEGVASGLNSALKMEEDEKALKHETLFSFVFTHDSKKWGRNFLLELHQAAQTSERPTTKKLNMDLLLRAYAISKKRAIFLDYDGTLSPLVKHPSLAAPTPRLLQILKKLTADERNQVSVLSGRDRDSLDSWLSNIPSLNLFAEHGTFQKLSGSDHWDFAHPNLDTSWHEVVLPILKYWEARTPGSFIEYKKVNMVWHYRQADLEYGEWQARELRNQLDENIVSRGLPVEILSGKKALEIRPHGFHKGTAVSRLLQEDNYDFVMIIGDDVTDEDMFSALEEAVPSPVPSPSPSPVTSATSVEAGEGGETSFSIPPASASPSGLSSSPATASSLGLGGEGRTKFSIVVGRHDSQAKWYVDGTRDVLQLLTTLVG